VITARGSGEGAGSLGLSVRERAPFTLGFELNGVGGPSAGLMFALGIVALVLLVTFEWPRSS